MAGTPGLHEDEPWLTMLDTKDLDILLAVLEVALMKIPRAHPDNAQNEMWHEICDLMDDGHASWQAVWPAEKAGLR